MKNIKQIKNKCVQSKLILMNATRSPEKHAKNLKQIVLRDTLLSLPIAYSSHRATVDREVEKRFINPKI